MTFSSTPNALDLFLASSRCPSSPSNKFADFVFTENPINDDDSCILSFGCSNNTTNPAPEEEKGEVEGREGKTWIYDGVHGYTGSDVANITHVDVACDVMVLHGFEEETDFAVEGDDLSMLKLNPSFQSLPIHNKTNLKTNEDYNILLRLTKPSAFSDFTNLKSINLEAISSTGTFTIGNKCFSKCTSLASLTLPVNTRQINRETFSGCTSLLTMDLHDSITTISNMAYSECFNLITINLTKTSALELIDEHAFWDCTSLRSIGPFTSSLTRLMSSAFFGCGSLTKIDLSKTILACIEEYTFYSNSQLEVVLLPDCLTSIGDKSFLGCNRLRVCSFPVNVLVEPGCFHRCDRLAAFAFEAGSRSVEEYLNNRWNVKRSIFAFLMVNKVVEGESFVVKGEDGYFRQRVLGNGDLVRRICEGLMYEGEGEIE